MIDDWVRVAMENDAVVVDLLIQLHQASPPTKTVPFEWTVRQPRSKPLPVNFKNNKNQPPPPPPPPPSTRSSPTTPLSWSTSQSGSGSAEESSRRRPSPPTKRPYAPRSKASGNVTSKKPRKKKSLVELKEEEMLLMKEKGHLKKELEWIRVELENQRAINRDYKRLKIESEVATNNEFCIPDLNIALEEVVSG